MLETSRLDFKNLRAKMHDIIGKARILCLHTLKTRKKPTMFFCILKSNCAQVKKRWTAKKGKAPTNDDAERIYVKVTSSVTLS